MTSKQVIVMRKDLNMRKGKMISQGSHASINSLLNFGGSRAFELFIDVPSNSAIRHWINSGYTKICVSVDSEVELLEIYNQAKKAGLKCAMITDAGLTEFNGVPTKTCCAIGPAWSDEIDIITGNLKLL